jgi:nucleolar protein 56
MSAYFLLECSLGYGLFEIEGFEEIASKLAEFQDSLTNFKKVQKIIKKVNFFHFQSSEQALENVNALNEDELTKDLSEFLSENIPKKKNECKLFCLEINLASKISKNLSIKTEVGDNVIELSRIIRQHLPKYLDIKEEDIVKSELGLGHSYSRTKCMFDVNRDDKPIVQSIALIDLLDKDINSFCMRVKEWFGWHFPELGKIISDNYVYIRVVKLIQQRNYLLENKEELSPKITEITLDPEITKSIIESCEVSMGSDISEVDLLNIKFFTEKVASLIKFRENLSNYLKDKMKKLAPNTSALVGESVAARLISHSGALSTLAKYPASTIQILGAEKALFRALKTRSKTPKYGLLYHSSFIGKAKQKSKGKISRYLANKLAMCSRIDYFSNDRLDIFGNELKKQIDERLVYLDSEDKTKPRKNVDVMQKVIKKIQDTKKEKEEEKDEEEKKVLNKKRKKSESEDEDSDNESIEIVKSKKKKKVVKEESDDE